MAHHHAHKPKRLSLLQSPLIPQEKRSPQIQLQPVSEYFGSEAAYSPAAFNEEYSDVTNVQPEGPQFQRHEEATTIELFYDLFFVANLTTFTSLHKINDGKSLRSYAGFFSILWFTWCQVSLFDVRFVSDGLLERTAKACQFGVMIGLAVVGPKFNPVEQYAPAFQTLAIILAASRFVLALQYLVVLFHVRSYKKSKTPMGLIALIYIVSGVVYGLTYLGFSKDKPHGYAYISWYVIAGFETILNVIVTSKYKVVSFKGTHLVQRMTLLTLIILGEGIIVVCKSITSIVKNEDATIAWTPATIGSITSSVVIIYFLYMLYFDWYNHNHFGSIRQQLWAILHFPLHLTLVLQVEGASQFIVWRKVTEVAFKIENVFVAAINDLIADPDSSIAALQNSLNETVYMVFEAYPPTYTKTYVDADADIASIGNLTLTANQTATKIDHLYLTVQNSLFETYGIKTPKSKYSVTDSFDTYNSNMDVFALVFIYFFVASGATLILMNTLNLLSKPKRNITETIRIAVNFLLGALMCCMAGAVNTSFGHTFATSSWVLPTVAFVLGFALVINHLHLFGSKHD